MKALELRVPPVLLVLICGFAMHFAARWDQLLAFANAALYAKALAVFAMIVVALGVWQFSRARTTVDPTRPHDSSSVVDSGVYALSRNPMYLGFVFGLSAWALHLGSLTALALVVPFMVYLSRFQIVPEERALRARFGAEFEGYCSRVRRWL